MKYIYKKIIPIIIPLLPLFVTISCNKNDDASFTKPQITDVSPIQGMKGTTVTLTGKNLKKVVAVKFGSVDADNFDPSANTDTSISFQVPGGVVDVGKVNITVFYAGANDDNMGPSASIPFSIFFSPISITSISPANVRPGGEITITGVNLDLIAAAVFKTNKKITSFTSQSSTTLKMIVPADAQTGTIQLLDVETIPTTIESSATLQVTLPVATTLSPSSVKAGSQLTITGTDLDLMKEIHFGGERIVKDTSKLIVSKSATQIVVKVPSNAQDGTIKLIPASGVVSESAQSLTMLLPTIATITPNPVRNGDIITVTGTNLDLITSTVFGGGKSGTIQAGGTPTQIMVKVPSDGTDGVSFKTDANKSVDKTLPMIVPTITSFTPTTVLTANTPSITITGTDLDLVSKVVFGGDWTGTVTGATTTQITIPVVPGSVSGTIKLITVNGTEVVSSQSLTITPNVPNVTATSVAIVGQILTITGTNMDVAGDMFFPGDFIATRFGAKTSTTIEVYIPEKTTIGLGKIKFVTDKNEIYYSPDIDIKDADALKYTIFDESLHSPFSKGGWGSPDIANTEISRKGSVSIKSTFTGSYSGGGQYGTWGNSPLSTSGTTYFVFSVYGGTGTNGKTLLINIAGAPQQQVNVDEGKWKDVKIALSSIGNPASLSEISFQDANWSGVVYIDQIGLK